MDKRGSDSKKGAENEKNEFEFTTLPAVVLVESLTSESFLPISCEFPESMLPINGVPLLSYTIEMLLRNGVTEIFLVAYSHKELLCEFVDKYRDSNRKSVKNTTITVIQLGIQCFTFGDAIRDLDFQIDIRDDFILVQGGVLCVEDLRGVIRDHKKKRHGTPNLTITLLFQESPPLSSLRNEDDEKVVVYDNKTNELIYWDKFDNGGLNRNARLSMKTFLRNASCSKSVVRYDLLYTGVAVCSPQLLKIFCETFDYDDLYRDFILNALVADIKQDLVHIHVLSNQYALRINNLRTYHLALQNACEGWLFPLVTDYSNLSCSSMQRYGGFNVFLGENVVLSEDSRLLSVASIGKNSRIGNNVLIEDSFIGDNCVIGDNCFVTGSVLLENVKICDNTTIDHSFVGRSVSIGENVTIKPYCVIGSGIFINKDSVIDSSTRISRYLQKPDVDSRSTSHFTTGGGGEDSLDRDKGRFCYSDLRRIQRLLSEETEKIICADGCGSITPNGVIWQIESKNDFVSNHQMLKDMVIFDPSDTSNSKTRSVLDDDKSDAEEHSNCENEDGSEVEYLNDLRSYQKSRGNSSSEDDSGSCRGGEDNSEFAYESYSLVKSGLENPVHIGNKILELKGLRFAFFKEDLDILNTILPLSLEYMHDNSQNFLVENSKNSINIRKFQEYCNSSGIKELINAFNRYESESYTCLVCDKLLEYSAKAIRQDQARIGFGSLLVSFEKLEFVNQSFILDWYNSRLETERLRNDAPETLSLLESDFVVKYIEWLREDDEND